MFETTLSKKVKFLVGHLDPNDKQLSQLEEIILKAPFETGTTNVKAKKTNFKLLLKEKIFWDILHKMEPEFLKYWGRHRFIVEDAWANIYDNKNHYTQPHEHHFPFCWILYLSDEGPGTYFNDFGFTIGDKRGRFVCFNGYCTHEVLKYNYKKPRLTCAFNAREFREWDKLELKGKV